MKRILLLLVGVLVLAACEDKKDNGKLDPEAMISIRPAEGVKAENPEHLSALEIVKQAGGMNYWNIKLNPDSPISSRSFGPANSEYRDFVNVRLLMEGTDIISPSGEYVYEFIEGYDIILNRELPGINNYDTIGYIRNDVMRAAQKAIKAAYDRGDYTTVYDEFNRAFTFEPITGAEWRALKAEGKN